jgi:hypothetical protein
MLELWTGSGLYTYQAGIRAGLCYRDWRPYVSEVRSALQLSSHSWNVDLYELSPIAFED